MAQEAELSEDYILELLKKDAQKVSNSYARSGTYDVLPKRPIGSAPKPNTRFLKNIIRDTDNHNAALKQKELGDAARRLRAMAKEQDRRSRDNSDQVGPSSRRDDEMDHTRKRKRDYDWSDRNRHGQSPHRRRARDRNSSSERDERRRDRRRHQERDQSRSPDHHSSRRERNHSRRKVSSHRDLPNSDPIDLLDDEKTSTRSVRHRREEKHSHRHRHSSYGDKDQNATHPDRRRQSAEKYHSSRRRRSSSGESEQSSSEIANRRRQNSQRDAENTRKKSNRPRSRSSSRASTNNHKSESRKEYNERNDRRKSSGHSGEQDHPHHNSISSQSPLSVERDSEDDDDDPLSEFLGPKPPPKKRLPQIRGRGATSFASGIDERFSSTYDPGSDMKPDLDTTENEDWDQALEALRDRQRFRQAGADRLLAAGFTKDEVERMERGGEKTEEDVRWTKKGEAREWDRGKTIDENGYVSVDGDKFGRLT